jgi:hypothetical protein
MSARTAAPVMQDAAIATTGLEYPSFSGNLQFVLRRVLAFFQVYHGTDALIKFKSLLKVKSRNGNVYLKQKSSIHHL